MDEGIWRCIAPGAPAAERTAAWGALQSRVGESSDFVEEHCKELTQLLLESVESHHVSKHIRKTRTAIIKQCLNSSESFVKEFTVRLLRLSKSYGCPGKYTTWLVFSVCVLQRSGGQDGMQQVVVKLIEAQDEVLIRMIQMNRVPSNRMYNCVRPVIEAHPGLLEMYMSRICSSPSGSPGLAWMVSCAITSLSYEEDVISKNISRLVQVFVDKILCGKTKEMPHAGELACFSDIMLHASQTDLETLFVPAGVKMAKRSPEISMAIANAAMSHMNADFSACGSELIALIIQQSKHGKEAVRERAVEMMQIVTRKTKDSTVLLTYAEAAMDALLAKDATRLKTPQEKSSMAAVLRAVAENLSPSTDAPCTIAESLCTLIETEPMADTKACLILTLGRWMAVCSAVPASFGNVAQLALKAAEPVRRAFLEICCTLCSSNNVAEAFSECVENVIPFVIDGSQKAAVQLDAIVSLACFIEAGKHVARIEEVMEKKGIWGMVHQDTCQYLQLDFLNGLSDHNAKLAICCSFRLLESSARISKAQIQGCCDALIAFSLHYDQAVRKEALKYIKAIVASDQSCDIISSLLDSFRSMCNSEKSLDFISPKSSDIPISKNFVYERHLGTLLAITPRGHARIPSRVAVALCIMGHHPKVSTCRGPASSWGAVLSACTCFSSSIESDVDGALGIALGEEWGIECDDEVISGAAIMAFVSLGKACGEKLYPPFMDKIREILHSKLHESLTAKQLRIYATPFGMVSNESEDGGLIPAELMEEILSDKTLIKPPIFAPSRKQSLRFLDDTLSDIENAKGKKEDPAAAARKKQLAVEAEVRLHVVELRDRLSRHLHTLGNFAYGARVIASERLAEISRPCMKLLSSPLVGDSSALDCINLIIACVPGIIGHFHSTMSVCFHLINKEEAKRYPEYNSIASSPYMSKAAEILIQATGGAIAKEDRSAVRGRNPLSPQLYSFFFPIINSILRSSTPTILHESLLEFIELHADVSPEDLSAEEEFSLLFHVLEVVPALRSTAQHLLTKLCTEASDYTTVFAAAIKGTLLSQSSSRLAALNSIIDSARVASHIDTSSLSLLWIAVSDVESENSAVGESIWNAQNAQISGDLIPKILPYILYSAEDVRKAACKGTGSLVSALKETDAQVPAETLSRVTSMYEKSAPIHQRLGIADCLSELSRSFSKIDVFTGLEFLLAHGFLDTNSQVREAMMAAGVAIVDGAGSEMAEGILPIMEKYLDNPTDKGLSEEEYDNVRLGAVVCIGASAQHMDPSSPKVVSIVQTLLEVLFTPSELVQRSVSDRLPPLIKCLLSINKSFVEDTVANLLQKCLGGETYGDRRGAAYGLSGCVKGLGLSSLKSYGIMERLKSGVENKKDQNAREGGLIAFECLSGKLGRLFEPYVIQILPMLLSSLGDGKAEVREAADAASRVIMSQLTAQGVKLVLPSLLGGAEEKQWRAKQGSIQLLGSMAYCAPKQLSSCLPQIVPILGEALADPHPKVSAAAKDAMDEVGSVIKNPEVSNLVPMLMSALSDPNKYNKKALDKLLSTIFVNTVDSASLALIIPVVHRGLKDRSGEVKKRAARIVGNLCTLMNDPKDMSPYLPQLMPELKDALIDPLPEVRGAAAKALGSLTKGMTGVQSSSIMDITPWLLETMRSESSSVERSGAAQGLAEVLAVKGATLLEQVLPEIYEGCDSKLASTREGSITLFKYLPHCMTEEFQKHLPDVLPRVLNGLADESEGVRDAAFAAGSVAVDLYAKTSLPLVLPAVEAGASDINWRIRQSSVELLGDLLFKVAGTSGRIQQDLNDDESEGISVESHGQAIIDVLGLERRNDVLARLYLARADVAYTVRSAALHVWKTIVTNTPKTLVEILPVLMTRVISGLSKESEEQRTSSGQCLGELVRKLGDRVLPRIVPILMEGAHSDDPLIKVGVLNGMREVISNASKTQLTEYMADILTEIQRLLCDEDDDVRLAAGGALEIIFQTGGGSVADSVIPSLLSGLHGDEEKVKKSLEGLRVVLGVRPQLLAAMVPKLVEPPLSRNDIVALGALSEVSGDAIHSHLSKVLPPLFRIFDENDDMSEVATKSLLDISTAVEEDGLHLLISQINRGFDTPETTYGACITLQMFCKNTDLDFQEHIGGLLTTLVPLLADDSSGRNLKGAWEALSAVTSKIPKEMAPSFVRPMKDAVTSAKDRMLRLNAKSRDRCLLLPGLLLPKALSPFLPTYLQGILQGSSAELRESSAEAIGDLVELTNEATLKPFVVQITGPLIRIVGDRFPSQTKTAILRTMGILVDKAGIALRPFIPQLQTTFVKCLPDEAREVRLQGATNIGKLSRMAPRLDQLAVDISINSMSADIDGPKEAYLFALASILKESGDKLKAETLEKVSEAITNGALSAIQTENESAIKNAARALGEYSLRCSDGELERIMNHPGFGPLCSPETGIGSRLCTATFASLAGPMAGTKLKEQNMLTPFIKTMTVQSKDVSVDVRMIAAVTGGRIILSELAVNASSESLVNIIPIFLAHLGPDQHIEVQKQTLAILRAIANASPDALVPHFVSLIPTIISTTKEATGATKLAAERTLAKVLQVESGDDIVTGYLARPDIGPVAKSTLTEPYLRRLLRIIDTDIDDLADYTIE